MDLKRPPSPLLRLRRTTFAWLASRSSRRAGKRERRLETGDSELETGHGELETVMQIEMTIKGLMVDPITNMPIIILRDKAEQRVLPIWVGVFEANAIALQIENVTTPRPMTHDLLRNVIHDLKADIQKIVVSDLKDNTFYALIYLLVNGEAMAIDARPSDAIALALRARAPIFVEDTVIDNAKTVDFAPEKGDSERLQKWLESLDPDDMGKYKM